MESQPQLSLNSNSCPFSMVIQKHSTGPYGAFDARCSMAANLMGRAEGRFYQDL